MIISWKEPNERKGKGSKRREGDMLMGHEEITGLGELRVKDARPVGMHQRLELLTAQLEAMCRCRMEAKNGVGTNGSAESVRSLLFQLADRIFSF
jgi:hypothetical protein